jgi:hypothetical protein
MEFFMSRKKKIISKVVFNGQELDVSKDVLDVIDGFCWIGILEKDPFDSYKISESSNPLFRSYISNLVSRQGTSDSKPHFESSIHQLVINLRTAVERVASGSVSAELYVVSSLLISVINNLLLYVRIEEKRSADEIQRAGEERSDESPKRLRKPTTEASEASEGSSSSENLRYDLPTFRIPVKRKMKKPIKPMVEKDEFNFDVLSIAKEWLEWSSSISPPNVKLDEESFYQGCMKLIKSKEMRSEELRSFLHFLKNDDFWKHQSLTPIGFLKLSKNGLKKIDNALLAMRKKINRENPLMGMNKNWNPFDEPYQ